MLPSFFIKTEINYKNGTLGGKWIWYFENGQIWYEESYKNGKQDGIRIVWYENGQKYIESNIKNGELIFEKVWDKDGSPK